MDIPIKLLSYLNEKKVAYEILHHPEAFTAQNVAAAEHIKGRHHAKVVMVKSGRPTFDDGDVSRQSGRFGKSRKGNRKPRFNRARGGIKDLFPDCAPGSMPPFGELYGVPTYVDRSLTKEDYIVFEAGTHTDAIKLSFIDFDRTAKPHIADIAVKLHFAKRT